MTKSSLILADSSSSSPSYVPTDLSGGDWLKTQRDGAYTTARTCCRRGRIFEWDTHTKRTASSALAMGMSISLTTLPQSLTTVATTLISRYLSLHPSTTTELKLTMLVSPSSTKEPNIQAHIAPLPPVPTSPVRVEVRGKPRDNALAKSSSWVSDRAPLEDLMRQGPNLNEFLLKSENGDLLEGSQTNFYAIVNGCLHTAGSGVLEGTVRRLALEVCETHGIPYSLTPPNLADVAEWEGCLISSTSRLLLPIDEIYVPSETEPSGEAHRVRSFDTGDKSIARKLSELVLEQVQSHSTPLDLKTPNKEM